MLPRARTQQERLLRHAWLSAPKGLGAEVGTEARAGLGAPSPLRRRPRGARAAPPVSEQGTTLLLSQSRVLG